MSDAAHTWTAPYLMPRLRPAAITPGQPVRAALGYAADGTWVWQDESGDIWPYGRKDDLAAAHEMALRGEYDG